MLDDFSTELKRLGGGASSILGPTHELDMTHFVAPGKQQSELAEMEHGGSSR